MAKTGQNANSKPGKSQYGLLLKGGHIIDPANHLNQKMDVAVTASKIAAVEPDIPPYWLWRCAGHSSQPVCEGG